jgi:uncharacterized protein (DUF488 family)
MPPIIYTIGHSNISADALNALLRQHDIELLADVRSAPFSRLWPQFNQVALRDSVSSAGIEYLFMGKELGGRPDDDRLRSPNGAPNYDAMARTPLYQQGLGRLIETAGKKRTALLCSEADPHHCHRYKLVTPTLEARGVEVRHILGDGSLLQETQGRLF